MCRRIRYWNKSRQQTVVRLRMTQRAQEVFQRLSSVILFFLPQNLFCHSFLVLQPWKPSSHYGWALTGLFVPQHLYGLLPLHGYCFFQLLSNEWHSAGKCCLHWNTNYPKTYKVTDICCQKYVFVFNVILPTFSLMKNWQNFYSFWINTKQFSLKNVMNL